VVSFKQLSSRAKELIDKRGGTERLKKDAAELGEIAKGKGSLSDKAKAAADALRQPGAGRGEGGQSDSRSAERAPGGEGTPDRGGS